MKNTTRARTAVLVISVPHDGPTVLTLTSATFDAGGLGERLA